MARHTWQIAALSLGLALLLSHDLSAQVRRPLEVTDSAVAAGRVLFHGSANCAACHGPEGVGTDSGPALDLGVWLYGNDSFEGIRSRVIHGIPKAYSLHDRAMPMRGWNPMTDEEVKVVAAYVWWISHPHRPS